MAEEVSEVVCRCVENGTLQSKSMGEWEVKAPEVSFTGTVESGLVKFTPEQKETLRSKNELDLTLNLGGYRDSGIKFPGSDLDDPIKLPISVEVKKLNGKEKIDQLKKGPRLSLKLRRLEQRLRDKEGPKPPRGK